MKSVHPLMIISICSLLSTTAWAVDKKDIEKVHAHNVATVPASTNSTSEKASMEKMDSQMKVMQEMHEKMMNAKTPQERKALMAEHMKAMQGGMEMMAGMSMKNTKGVKATMPAKNESYFQSLEKRMQLMEKMMEMMMDRSSIPETLGN